jgi:hypothetical protein
MSFPPALNARSSKTPRCPRESTKLYASILIYGEQFRTVSYRESNRLHTNERPASLFVVPSELRRTAVRNLVPSYILRSDGGSRLFLNWMVHLHQTTRRHVTRHHYSLFKYRLGVCLNNYVCFFLPLLREYKTCTY